MADVKKESTEKGRRKEKRVWCKVYDFFNDGGVYRNPHRGSRHSCARGIFV